MASAAGGLAHLSSDQNHLNVSISDHGAWTTTMSSAGIVPVNLSGQQLFSDSVQRFDPGHCLITPINPMMAGISLISSPPPPPLPDIAVIKEIIQSKSCTLLPQNPELPPPSTRERPPGCRTVFVGGLPENATDEIIREVFEHCGEITAIRKSKKNFCHIRFSQEFMVDKALYLSGYRMQIGSSTEKKDSGRIHVDFAQARDDLYEWECKQRLLAREERHRYTLHEDHLQAQSPPAFIHFSDHEAAVLAEKLKGNHKFAEAMAVLFTWIDRGEVNRRSANQFYSVIQLANSHVRRLMSEKAQHDEAMERAKEEFKHALQAILAQFEQITAVFSAASKKKAWDHFSKAQRKNIEMWRKQCEELRNAHSEEIMDIRREEETEKSDEDLEENPRKRLCTHNNNVLSGLWTSSSPDQASLSEENDSLRWQLDSYRTEVDLLTKEQGLYRPELQMQQLQQGMMDLQHQLVSLQDKLKCKEAELEQAREEHRQLEGEVLALRERETSCAPPLLDSRIRRNNVVSRVGVTSEKEALLLGIISTFLHVHPFGANLEYLESYIHRLDSKVSGVEIERLMLRLPSMFRQELSGVGATLEKRWKFCGFEGLGSVMTRQRRT
ncbi:ecto-NOX disulfide-thiol exchanger 1 isoform X3 [Cynoglossus semilaevis]|uniref:ecto-NOX disulfide-thiol exchanger 1 isoform X3 n=1 Tax=Cynoglossus semilaevis TaxID=244447 RepID=UPI00049551FF|nr:ecto-NOX disulfide-thiol exchanger 1 isoform X3 [Cynoglossus semilaevis]